jgi:hypothetical protein
MTRTGTLVECATLEGPESPEIMGLIQNLQVVTLLRFLVVSLSPPAFNLLLAGLLLCPGIIDKS